MNKHLFGYLKIIRVPKTKHSTGQHKVQTRHQPIQRNTSTDRRGEEVNERVGGVAPPPAPPVQVALPFLWATVLLKFARNWRSQCAKTCDCHSAPWPMGGMNGTVTARLVEKQLGCGSFPQHRGNGVCRVAHTHPTYMHKTFCDLLHVLCIHGDIEQLRHRTGPQNLCFVAILQNTSGSHTNNNNYKYIRI